MKPGWGIAISLFLCCCLWESEAVRRVGNPITVYNGGISADLGFIHICRTGYANGYSLKVGTGSSGGTHGVRFHCSDNGLTITSREGRIGEWTPYVFCNTGHFLRAFRLRILEAENSEDGEKLLSVQFQCSDDSTLREFGPDVGTLTNWSKSCKQGICGLQTNVKAQQDPNISLLINMSVYCCDG